MKTIILVIQCFAFPAYKLFGLIFVAKQKRQSLLKGDSPLLVISNHISFLDPFIVIAHFAFIEARRILPVRTIMNNNLLYRNPFAPLLLLLGCFPARPRKGRLHGLEAARAYAKDYSLFFFPEGGIKGRKNAKRLRTGAAVVASESQIDVLPVFLKRKGFRFHVIRGEVFKQKDTDIEKMMSHVWALKDKA